MLARFANRIAAIEELSELILAPEAPSACSTAIWEKGAIASNRPNDRLQLAVYSHDLNEVPLTEDGASEILRMLAQVCL